MWDSVGRGQPGAGHRRAAGRWRLGARRHADDRVPTAFYPDLVVDEHGRGDGAVDGLQRPPHRGPGERAGSRAAAGPRSPTCPTPPRTRPFQRPRRGSRGSADGYLGGWRGAGDDRRVQHPCVNGGAWAAPRTASEAAGTFVDPAVASRHRRCAPTSRGSSRRRANARCWPAPRPAGRPVGPGRAGVRAACRGRPGDSSGRHGGRSDPGVAARRRAAPGHGRAAHVVGDLDEHPCRCRRRGTRPATGRRG